VAETITVGTLRALLTVDTAKFEGGMKGAEQSTAKLGATAERVGRQVDKMANSLKGDRLISQANNMTAAVTKLGGAQGMLGGVSKLTTAEMGRMSSTTGEALAKYKALGMEAPPALQALHRSLTPVAPQLGLMNQGVTALKSNFSQMFGVMALANVASNAVLALVGNVGSLIAQGAKMRGLEQSFERLTAGIGETGEAMLEITRDATQGLVTDLSLVQSTNKAILLGLPITRQEMGELAKTATVLGRAMGQDATKSLDDLITALGRSSPLILDNLGLTVKVGEANETYARSLGKSVEQLTEAEKKTAFYNAAMDVARLRTQELGDVTDGTASAIGRLGVAWDNFWNKVGSGGDKALGTLFNVFSNPRGILDFMPGRNEAAARFNQDFIASATGRASMIGSPGFRVASPTFGTPFRTPDGREDADDYKAKLVDAQAAVRGLTAAQKEQLDAALKLGNVSKEFLASIGLTDGALKLYTASTKESTKADTASAKAKAELAERMGFIRQEVALLQGMAAAGQTGPLFQESALPGDDFRVQFEGVAPALKATGDELARINAITSPEAWNAAQAADAMERLGITSRSDLRKTAAQAAADYQSIVRAVGSAAPEAVAAFRKMVEAQREASGQLPSYWETTIGPRMKAAVEDIGQSFSVGIGDMLVGLRGFKDTWTDIWDGIRQSFANVLSGMLNDFLGGFLRKIVGGATGMSFGGGGGGVGGLAGSAGSSLMGLFGGGGAAAASGLTAAQMGTPALGSLLGATGGAGAAGGGAAGGGAAGAMGFLANPAFWTNPWTIGVAAAITTGLLVWKKGLFRGGWEGIEGNARRDKHLAQWGPAGTGPGSGFHNLAAFLTGQTGEEGGGRIFRDFQSGNKGRFESAQAAIVAMAAKSGKKIQSFSLGGFVPPGAVVPAVLHGGSKGEIVAPLAKLAEMAGGMGSRVMNFYIDVRSWDGADTARVFRQQIIPDLKQALTLNTDGLASHTARALDR
jgi:hypothetical protein